MLPMLQLPHCLSEIKIEHDYIYWGLLIAIHGKGITKEKLYSDTVTLVTFSWA
jgi:hypothetical protein